MWDEHSEIKKKNNKLLHCGVDPSQNSSPYKHTPSQTWLKHKFPFYSAPLTHPHKHPHPPLGPVTSTHGSQTLQQSKQPRSSCYNKVHPLETTRSRKAGKERPRPGKQNAPNGFRLSHISEETLTGGLFTSHPSALLHSTCCPCWKTLPTAAL